MRRWVKNADVDDLHYKTRTTDGGEGGRLFDEGSKQLKIGGEKGLNLGHARGRGGGGWETTMKGYMRYRGSNELKKRGTADRRRRPGTRGALEREKGYTGGEKRE